MRASKLEQNSGDYGEGVSKVQNIVSATYTVVAEDSGTVYSLNLAAGIVVTLPSCEVGLTYKFIVGTTFTGAGKINTAATTELYSGYANVFDPATATDMNTFIPDNSDDDTIDLGSAAQGWLVGSTVKLTCTSSTRWHCEAQLHGDGSLATPFE